MTLGYISGGNMKRLHYMFLIGCLLALFVAGVGSATAQSANGKELYRNNCKVCHDKGSPQGQYTPMTLSQDQWRTFFKAKLLSSHKNTVHPKSGVKLFEQLTPEQIKAIQRFAIDHAADSEQPATCG
jgi:cytochrome c5